MSTVLICPPDHQEVPLISAQVPLAMAPVLGETVVEYWLSHLASVKVKQAAIVSQDRAEMIRTFVGSGSRWGIELEVVSEIEELTLEQASGKYNGPAIVMEHLPGLLGHSLFAGYESWYRALLAWIPRAKTPDRVGPRELADGIWVGLHGRVSPTAKLEAPCWLGDHVYVGDNAIIGPGTILENGAFVESEAVINGSIIGPDTLVGRYMRIANSLALGDTLVDWQTGVESIEPNAFLLCSLHPRHSNIKSVPFMERIAEWFGRWDSDESLKEESVLSNEVTERIARQVIE